MMRFRRSLLTATLLLAAVPGCRVFQKSGDGEKKDPLMGRYIPKTDLPVPGRDTAGRKDPLLTQPAKDTRRANVDKDTFRNTTNTSIAGLAGRPRIQNSGLSLGDKRPEATPAVKTGTPLTRDPAIVSETSGVERYTSEFERLNARVERPVRDTNGEYVLGASVKVNDSGAMRRYEGRGASVDAAAKELLAAIRADAQ